MYVCVVIYIICLCLDLNFIFLYIGPILIQTCCEDFVNEDIMYSGEVESFDVVSVFELYVTAVSISVFIGIQVKQVLPIFLFEILLFTI